MMKKQRTTEEPSRTWEVQKRASTTSSWFSTFPHFSFDDGDNSATIAFLTKNQNYTLPTKFWQNLSNGAEGKK